MFSIEIMSTFKAIKPNLKQSYDKQNLTLVVISYEIYETRRRLVSYEMTTHVRSSMYYPKIIALIELSSKKKILTCSLYTSRILHECSCIIEFIKRVGGKDKM